MPTFMKGNMWSVWDSADLFIITTNATVNNRGELVMGRGIAKQARDRFPGLARKLADELSTTFGFSHFTKLIGDYGFWHSPRWPEDRDAKLGLFQVKRHWGDSADSRLIQNSVGILHNWLTVYSQVNIHMNFPGIGNGKLAREEVLPYLTQLPDRVHVWEYGS